jgi:hypothetical protein
MTYIKGELLTVGEIKSLPQNALVHIRYLHRDYPHVHPEDRKLYTYLNGFHNITFKDDGIMVNGDYEMSLFRYTDTTVVDELDQWGASITIHRAVKK